MLSRRVLVALLGVASASWLGVGCDSAVSGDVDAGELTPDATTGEPGDGGLDASSHDAGGPSYVDATVDAGADARDASAADASPLIDAGPAFVCEVEAPTSCSDAGLRYGDVAPIFAERCVICHAGNWNGPWPLNDYQHVADWEDTIRSNLLDCTMPPLDAGVPITRGEREQILSWLRCGLPR